MKKCSGCKELLPLDSFSPRKETRDGRRAKCRDCTRWSKQEYKARAYAWVMDIKMTSGCVDCGYRKHPDALDFDHLPGFVKSFSIGSRMFTKRATLEAEIAKCEVVCANCHRIRTAKRRKATP